MDLRLYEAEQRAKDKSLARKIFIACVILIFLTAATCEGQELPRYKYGDYWHATSLWALTNESDTVVFGSVYYPTPYEFYEISITTTGGNKCVKHLIMKVKYKNGIIDYVSAYNEFNCEGISFFRLTTSEYLHFKEYEMESIEFTNNFNQRVFTVNNFGNYQYYKIALNN